MAPPKLTAVDTTGAGDIFGGSALSRILQYDKDPADFGEKELVDIARFATAAASLSTTRPGGITSVPEREEVENLLRANQ